MHCLDTQPVSWDVSPLFVMLCVAAGVLTWALDCAQETNSRHQYAVSRNVATIPNMCGQVTSPSNTGDNFRWWIPLRRCVIATFVLISDTILSSVYLHWELIYVYFVFLCMCEHILLVPQAIVAIILPHVEFVWQCFDLNEMFAHHKGAKACPCSCACSLGNFASYLQ